MSRFLSVGFSLQVDPSLAKLTRQRLDIYSIPLGSWLISHLSEKTLEDVRGKVGQDVTRKEIREHFSHILFPEGDHNITDVLFTNFAVQ
jgi:flagellar FliL protein